MKEEELLFCLLCGPLEDAVDMIDAGRTEEAKYLLRRVTQRAYELCEKWEKK